MHGGTQTEYSAGLGHGNEFTVRPPVGGREQGKDAAPVEETPGTGKSVLIVDDNVDAAEGLAMILQLKGHTTQTAHDGEAALRAWEEARQDVVLLDIGLPRMDGVEVARRIRAHPQGQHTRLIAITGWGQEGDRERTREAKFDEHLTKPVDAARLLALIG